MLAVKQDAAPWTSLRLGQSRVGNTGEGIRLHHHNNISSVYDKFLPVDSAEREHSHAVTKHYLAAENSVDDGYWDNAFREVEYYENQEAPHPPYPEDKGQMKGEFDILTLNYEDKNALYKEVKTSRKCLNYAEQQMQRAEDHFEDTDWDVITYSVLE